MAAKPAAPGRGETAAEDAVDAEDVVEDVAGAAEPEGRSIGIFVRTQHPDEGLQIDHVARFQIREIPPHPRGEGQKTLVSLPVWPRGVLEVEIIRPSRPPRHVGFEKE